MEYFDICDENGRPTGKVVSRQQAHKEGILHRTAHVWIVKKEGDDWLVLLQKRSKAKDSFPGMFDTSSAGHVPAGEEPAPSACRELREELGISAVPGDLARIGFFRIQYEKVFHESVFKDNEATWVYVLRKPVDLSRLKLQESEVETVEWFGLRQVMEEIKVSRERFCVPSQGIAILADYLRKIDLGIVA